MPGNVKNRSHALQSSSSCVYRVVDQPLAAGSGFTRQLVACRKCLPNGLRIASDDT
jgi:hypothetical protein